MKHSEVYDARATVRETVVSRISDAGAAQTADVITNEGGVHASVPILQQWGFASNPPLSGLRAVLLAIGGDPANWRAILHSVQRRMGGLARGETAMYGDTAARVAIRQGGTIEVMAGSTVLINAPNAVTIVAGAGGVSITGAVTVTGTVAVTGDIDVTGNIHCSGTVGH